MPGLGWVRSKQRVLMRAVLALYGLAWLQAALIPCVSAHEAPPTIAAAPYASVADPHAHGGPHGPVPAPYEHDVGTGPDCLYCPPTGHASTGHADESCDGHGGCAYPHEPQVDARAGPGLGAALPVVWDLRLPVADVPSMPTVTDRAAAVPRVGTFVSYCRRIE